MRVGGALRHVQTGTVPEIKVSLALFIAVPPPGIPPRVSRSSSSRITSSLSVGICSHADLGVLRLYEILGPGIKPLRAGAPP